MKPYRNRLLIQPDEVKTVLVSADQKLQQIGTVLAVGYKPWYDLRPRFVQVGDRVVFNVWGIDRVELDGKEYFFVLEDEDFVLAKLPRDEMDG